MVSGFEKRMLSGMFGLLSVDSAKAGEVARTTVSVTAPYNAPARKVVEICRESSEEDVSSYIIAPAILVTRILLDTFRRTAGTTDPLTAIRYLGRFRT
jgi:hypothetical protein